jgi:hypothetical protein
LAFPESQRTSPRRLRVEVLLAQPADETHRARLVFDELMRQTAAGEQQVALHAGIIASRLHGVPEKSSSPRKFFRISETPIDPSSTVAFSSTNALSIRAKIHPRVRCDAKSSR